MKDRILKINNTLLRLLNRHIFFYPTAVNISYFWSFGSLAGLFLSIQIITGILLAMHYAPNITLAFDSLEHIMRDVNFGWLLRYAHANGASFFFLVVYSHIARGIYYRTYIINPLLWHTGMIIFVLMMATAFTGYILPWGQMSFWGATVITNIITALPMFGERIALWLWGGYAVDNATLNRFFSIHYTLPFLIAAIAILHITLLHMKGSANPLILSGENKKITFYPYYLIKDIFGMLSILTLYSIIIFYYPNILGHTDNYILANPLVTPTHIVPEWYFLPFHAILRACPNKIGGIISMALAILILFLLPLLDRPKDAWWSSQLLWKILCTILFSIFLLLGWLGAQHVDYTFVILSKLATTFYFIIFLSIPMFNFLNDWLIHYCFITTK